jgi:hypothetical protein
MSSRSAVLTKTLVAVAVTWNLPRVILAIVVPVLATIAAEIAIATLARRIRNTSSPEETKARQEQTIRTLLRKLVLAAALVYFIVIAVGPELVWEWYSAAVQVSQRDILISIAGVAIAAWSGCLIAFAVRQRLTVELSQGLRFMLYACFTPLIALTENGIALRTLAFLAAVFWGNVTFVQFGVSRRKLKLELKLSISPWRDEPPIPENATEQAGLRYLREFISDRGHEWLFGWRASVLLCLFAIVVLAFSDEAAVVICSLLSLRVGITLAFFALVLPRSVGEDDTPTFRL